jgi:hypothetical protein
MRQQTDRSRLRRFLRALERALTKTGEAAPVERLRHELGLAEQA